MSRTHVTVRRYGEDPKEKGPHYYALVITDEQSSSAPSYEKVDR